MNEIFSPITTPITFSSKWVQNLPTEMNMEIWWGCHWIYTESKYSRFVVKRYFKCNIVSIVNQIVRFMCVQYIRVHAKLAFIYMSDTRVNFWIVSFTLFDLNWTIWSDKPKQRWQVWPSSPLLMVLGYALFFSLFSVLMSHTVGWILTSETSNVHFVDIL